MTELNLILIKYLGDRVIFNLYFEQRNRLCPSFFNHIKLALVLTLAIFIQACATQPKLATKVTSVEQLSNWNARGKLSLKNSKDKLSGYFFWQQKQKGEFKLVITSFIGTNLMTLTYDSNATELQLDGKTYRGEDPELLVYELTGNYIPVNSMASWMLAQAPMSAEKTIEQQKLKSFTYIDNDSNNWQVKYQSYKDVSFITLPEKMTIEGLDNRIKLTINDWELLAP